MAVHDPARPYRILGVFAHPDDESFGPGGTIARYAAEGTSISIITFTRGERSTIGNSLTYTPEQLGAVRTEELRMAVQVLGGTMHRVLSYPDLGLTNIPQHELVEQVILAIDEVKPHVVLTFDTGGVSRHPDHIAMSLAATEAFRRVARRESSAGGSPWLLRLYYWVVPERITAYLRDALDVNMAGVPEDKVTCAIDVSAYLQVQHQAVTAHSSQSTPVPLLYQTRVAAQSGKEFFRLAASTLPDDNPKPDDLLAGLPSA